MKTSQKAEAASTLHRMSEPDKRMLAATIYALLSAYTAIREPQLKDEQQKERTS